MQPEKGSVGSCKWQTITIYTCRAAQKKKKNKRNDWDYKLTFDSPIRSYPKHQMRYHSGVKKIVIDYNDYCKILRCMMSLSTKIPSTLLPSTEIWKRLVLLKLVLPVFTNSGIR